MELTAEDLELEDPADSSTLQKKITNAAAKAPALSANDRKVVRAGFADFWKKFITKCPNKVLYDENFVSLLNAWLPFATQAKYREVRYVATVAALNVMSGLVSNALRVKKEIEKSKSSSPKKTNKLSDQKQQHLDELTALWDKLFTK